MGDVIRSVKIEVSGEDKGASATMRRIAEAEKALAQEAKASLQVQAQAGDAAAKANLQRLATAEKFSARKDVLGKIAFGQGMGPEVAPIAAQRQAAQAALEKLAAQERGVTASEATSAFGGSVNGQLAGAWGAVIDNTAKQAASAQKAVAEKLKQGAEHEGGEGLAGAFLGIKHFEHLAKGAGVMLVGHLLAEATDKAKEFADALREGEKSAAEMTGDFLKGLPIVGGFAQAGQNLREIFTGEAFEIKRITEEAKVATEHVEFLKKKREEAAEEHKTNLREIGQLERQAGQVGAAGPEAAGNELVAQAEEAAAEARQALEKKKKDNEEAFQKKISEDLKARNKIVIPDLVESAVSGGAGGAGAIVNNAREVAEAKARLAEIDKRIAQARQERDDENAKAAEDARRKEIANLDLAERKRKEIQENFARNRERSLAAVESQTAAQQSRNRGDERAAIEEDFKQRLEKEKQAAADEAEARLKAIGPDDTEARVNVIFERLQREGRAEDLNAAEKQAALEANTNAQLDHQLSIGHQLADLRVNSLRAEAEAGRASAKVEADRLQIANEFQAKREAILKVLREDKTLTDSQRQALGQSLGGLGLQEAQAAARLEHPVVPGMGTAPNFQTLTGTGLAQFAGASAENEQVAAQQRAAKDLEKSAEDTKKAAAALAEAAGLLAAISAF